MSILDEWAERHIEKALKNGELSSLPGEGKPLVLDDNSHVPESLCGLVIICLRMPAFCPQKCKIEKMHYL